MLKAAIIKHVIFYRLTHLVCMAGTTGYILGIKGRENWYKRYTRCHPTIRKKKTMCYQVSCDTCKKITWKGLGSMLSR